MNLLHSTYKRNLKFFSISAVLFGFLNVFITLQLFLCPEANSINLIYTSLGIFVAYLTPLLAMVSIFLSCKSIDSMFLQKELSKLQPGTLMAFILTVLTLTYFASTSQASNALLNAIYFVSIGLVSMFYLKFLQLLWVNKHQIKKIIYIYIHIVFCFILINESLYIVNRHHQLSTNFTLLFLFIVSTFFMIQYQGHIVDNQFNTSKKQSLYKESSDILNKFLTLKNLQVENLETEISTNTRLYKQIFDFSPDSFIMFNSEEILYSNNALIKLLGVKDEQDFANKKIWDFIHPHSIAAARSAYDALVSGKETSIVELKFLSLDHKVKHVKVSSSIAFYEDTFCILACCHDLSGHYKQERINAKLEKDVADEKFKVEFFADISHDLKTPINVIYSAVQLQDMCALSNEYDEVLVYNNIIKQNCLRLQKLLNDVLDTTKIDAQHFKSAPELCNIISSIEYITESITSYIKDKDISIIFDTNVEIKYAMTDLSLIERILLNLISNAIKYGRQDGHVWVNLHDEGDHLIISIKDDGTGIPESETPKIFNRFYRAEYHSDNTVSSNGIGLSLVKSIIEILKGTISCVSTEGIGSEFIVVLPMKSHKGDELNHLEYAASTDLNNNLDIELSDI